MVRIRVARVWVMLVLLVAFAIACTIIGMAAWHIGQGWAQRFGY